MIRIFLIALTISLFFAAYDIARNYNSSSKGSDSIWGAIIGYHGNNNRKPVDIKPSVLRENKGNSRTDRGK